MSLLSRRLVCIASKRAGEPAGFFLFSASIGGRCFEKLSARSHVTRLPLPGRPAGTPIHERQEGEVSRLRRRALLCPIVRGRPTGAVHSSRSPIFAAELTCKLLNGRPNFVRVL